MISRSNMIWFSVLLVFVLLAAGFFIMRIRPVMRETEQLSSQLERMISQRRELISRPEGPPSEELLRMAREETRLKAEILEELESEIEIQAPELMPERISRPNIYWLDTLRRKRTEISGLAESAGLDVPPALGFGDGLPDDPEVPKLLFRLHVVEELVVLAADSRLRSITAVSFGDGGQRRDARDQFGPVHGVGAPGEPAAVAGLEDMGVKKLSITFSTESTLDNLLNFMMLLRNANYLYVIDDLRLETIKVERVEVEEAERTAAPSPVQDRRRRDPHTGDFVMDPGSERGVERVERRILERFLKADFEISMYYVPARTEDAEASLPGSGVDPGAGSPVSPRPTEPPRDTGERSRIIR